MSAKELARVKEAILNAKEEGSTYRHVATLFGVGKSVVHQVYKRFLQSNTVENLPRSGRPRKSTKRNDLTLTKILNVDPKKTTTDVTKYANERLKLRPLGQPEISSNVKTCPLPNRRKRRGRSM